MVVLYWIFDNWFILIVFLCVLYATILHINQFLILSPKQRKEVMKDTILDLVLEAEKQLGSKTGEMKLQLVIKSFYKKYPIAKFLIKEDRLIAFIEDSVQKMKETLEEE